MAVRQTKKTFTITLQSILVLVQYLHEYLIRLRFLPHQLLRQILVLEQYPDASIGLSDQANLQFPYVGATFLEH